MRVKIASPRGIANARRFRAWIFCFARVNALNVAKCAHKKEKPFASGERLKHL
jgi:hypothetical protein